MPDYSMLHKKFPAKEMQAK